MIQTIITKYLGRLKYIFVGHSYIGYTYKGSIITLRTALLLLLASITIGTIGFILIEEYSFIEAFYMTIITISTVGFTEVEPLSDTGRLFTSLLIVTNIGIFAYALYAFTNYFIEGEIFKKMHIRLIENRIQQLKDHIIICGYGRYGQEISEHFAMHKFPYVVIDIASDTIEEIQGNDEAILYIEGDATNDDVLLKAGIKNAKTLVTALPDDTDNVFAVLTARELNKNINIISRVSRLRAASKLKLAGANHTIMPEQIGGFYMATLVTKPGAVEFFSFLTNKYESDILFEEIKYEDVQSHYQGKSIEELKIRKVTGCNIIGYKSPTDQYIVNPEPSTILVPGTSFIAIGSHTQIETLRNYWKNEEN